VGLRCRARLPRIASYKKKRIRLLRELCGVVPTESALLSSSASGIRLARGYIGAGAPPLSSLATTQESQQTTASEGEKEESHRTLSLPRCRSEPRHYYLATLGELPGVIGVKLPTLLGLRCAVDGVTGNQFLVAGTWAPPYSPQTIAPPMPVSVCEESRLTPLKLLIASLVEKDPWTSVISRRRPLHPR
jgi:hypothetical protein